MHSKILYYERMVNLVRRAGRVSLAAAAIAFVSGCGGGGSLNDISVQQQQTVVGQWNATLLQAIRNVSPGPTVSARQIAIVHTAMFDAWAAYDSTAVGTRLGGTLRRPANERTDANKTAAVSFAAYRALMDLMPTQKALYDAVMTSLSLDPTNTALDSTPAGIGNQAAQAVIAYRHNDGSNQLGNLGGSGPYADYTGYAPVNTVSTINDPNHWQPLQFSTGATPGFLTPQWGQVKTFAITNIPALRPPAPAQAGSAKYLEQAQEIVDLTANLTDKQKMIAEYWANGPKSELPPGHWCLFAEYVSERDRHNLDQDVKMFFILGNALLDASICCWDAKRTYDYVRPITAIHYLFKDQTIKGWGGPGFDTVDVLGQNWIPYQPGNFITPPFAEYTSGHSTFSAAGAEVLKRFTGSDSFGSYVQFLPGSSMHDPGRSPKQLVELSWSTFSEAADEAGMSRRYGGIHFKDGDERARQMGRVIGATNYDKAMTYIDGTGTVNP